MCAVVGSSMSLSPQCGSEIHFLKAEWQMAGDWRFDQPCGVITRPLKFIALAVSHA